MEYKAIGVCSLKEFEDKLNKYAKMGYRAISSSYIPQDEYGSSYWWALMERKEGQEYD